MTLQQLPLGFRLRDDATFANFFPGDNQIVLAALRDMVRGQPQAHGEKFIYVWGPPSSGRSHLLQAVCHAAPEFARTALYLSLQQLEQPGLENIDLLCIDDIDQIAGNNIQEEQLFHLFNRVRSNNKFLIIVANTPPASLNIKLPDLKSRLSWGLVFQLHPLNDEQKLTALQMRAQTRGLDLDPLVGKFLLRRCPRNMDQLFAMLEQLDQASLVKQRRLTIPFVKDVLGV